ncbi:MAG: DUF6133 family protein [Clostridiales bacterium]|nr:DUF6133 family protein [Clostridiales bacterium]
MNFLKSIVNKIKNGVRAVVEKAESVIVRTQVVLASSTAENYVDSGLKILIAVVIGALLLTGIYKLFNTTIMPTVTSKVTELFNYSGT